MRKGHIRGGILATALLLAGCGASPAAALPTAPPAAAPTQAPTVALPTGQPTVAAASATPAIDWVRRAFDSAWDVEIPQGWAVDADGLHQGNLSFSGSYDGREYIIAISYPIAPDPSSKLLHNLDGWVEEELAPLAPAQRQAVRVVDIAVAGAPAKKVLNLPEKIYDDGATRRFSDRITHATYIWRHGGRNPRLVVIKPGDAGPVDVSHMEALLDRFLAGIR
jgi:hypothetical protein